MTMRHTPILLLILAIAALAGCSAHSGANRDQGLSLMERFQAGQDLFAPGDKTGKALGKDGRAAQAAALLTGRGDAAMAQGRSDLALRLYGQALELDPGQTRARLHRGLVLLEGGLPDAALAEFQAVLAASPGHAGALEAAGRACLALGRPNQARELLLAALEADPGRASALRCLGAAQTRLGEHAEAAQAFLKAAALDPSDAEALGNAGMSLLLLGRQDQALEVLMRAVRQGRPGPRLYNNLGLALYRAGRPNQALEAFAAAGGEAAAHNNLGWFQFQDGCFAEAMANFQRAMELSPTFYVRAGENLKRARLAAGFQAAIQAEPQAPAQAPGADAAKAWQGPAAAATLAADSGDALVTRAARPWRPPALKDRQGASYTVHLSSWRTQKSARQDAGRRHNSLGMEAYVFRVDLGQKGVWWRVTAGTFHDLDAARAALARLEREGLGKARIICRSPGQDRPSAAAAPGPLPGPTPDMDL